jgi:hypothetical protein
MTQSSTIDLPSSQAPSADVLRVHREAIPADLGAIIKRLKYIITLRGVQSVTINTEELVVERACSPLKDIIPENPDVGLSVAGLLADLTLDEIKSPAHPIFLIQAAADAVAARGLQLVAVVMPDMATLTAFLGLAEGDAPRTCLGHPVVYLNDGSEKIVVLGSPTSYIDDTVYGVLIDPFLEEAVP